MALRAAVRWKSGDRVGRWDYSNVGCWCVSLLVELCLTACGAVEGAPDGLPLEGHEGPVSRISSCRTHLTDAGCL